ncbi:hypothetical protein [Dactylosporangium matsuzakiense]|uniref:Uncharacterized protein n=1 Tax=Dactylosporangium matsuzakiense TaxID=53360 RepID=A0A9W6KJU4_9ACTN|nr:hypothetical protein [Dactylosporangium matsuzakiense]UWZ44184.1 hypothetical protein Dmats_43510 [Dactylosporangium matsuzakiense]GLL03376.1 hypothetical protein GCM10017581_051210 [Dactylosporangium matsuzakiense]
MILRWTCRALVAATAVGSALVFGTAAAAPPGAVPAHDPARAVSNVVITGVTAATLLLLLAGAVLAAAPRLRRLVRVLNARRSVR